MNPYHIYPEHDVEFLSAAGELVRDHEINLPEEKVLELLQIKYRWPKKSIEVINQLSRSSEDYFSHNQYINYTEWKRLYDLGFTSILCNIMDLTKDLRELDDKLLEIKGSPTMGNLYFSKGTTKHRVSFPIHEHDYHVIAKGIYGKTTWLVKDQEVDLLPGEVFILPAGTPHAVLRSPEPRLSLTLNISG